MRIAALLIVLLLPLAAAEPHVREDQPLDSAGRAVALAGTGTHVGVGILDAKSTLGPQDKDLNSWFLYEVGSSGYIERQAGGADPSRCDSSLSVADDCDSDVDFVAISHGGERMAVASQSSASTVQVVFIDLLNGEVAQKEVSGIIRGLDVDRVGDHVAAAFDTSGVSSGGSVWFWTWGGSFDGWTKETDAPATALDLSRDGQRVMVAAGSNVHIMQRQESAAVLSDSWAPRTVAAVSFSDRSDHLGAAGDDRGGIRLYADRNGGPERILNVPGSQTATTAIALSPDGSQVAVALGKNLRVWSLRDAPVLFDHLLADGDHGATISLLAYDREGDDLVVASVRDLALWATVAPVQQVWKTSLPADLRDVSVAASGDRMAAVFGSTLRMYEAHRAATLSLSGSSTAEPGSTRDLSLKITNTGDRRLSGTVQLTAPSGVEVGIDHANVTLLPGKSATLSVAVDVPASFPPGALEVTASFLSFTAAKSLSVPAREIWAMSPGEEALSKAIESGGRADYRLRIRNAGNVEASPPLETSVSPAGWTVAVAGVGSLAPGDEVDITVRITAPAGAANLARGSALVGLPGELPLELVATVGASFQPTLDLPGRISLGSGETVQVEGRVRNAGNAPDGFELRVGNAPAGWSVTFAGGGSERIVRGVPSGGEEAVALLVHAPAGTTATTYLATIDATSLADPSKSASRQVELAVENGTETGGKKSPVPVVLVLAALALAARRR